MDLNLNLYSSLDSQFDVVNYETSYKPSYVFFVVWGSVDLYKKYEVTPQ